MGYKAILFSIDGDWVTDCQEDTIEQVVEQVADLGSRWIFYPLPMIIKDYGGCTMSSQRVVSLDCLDPFYQSILQWAQGKSIKTIKRELSSNKELQNELIASLQ